MGSILCYNLFCNFTILLSHFRPVQIGPLASTEDRIPLKMVGINPTVAVSSSLIGDYFIFPLFFVDIVFII